MKASSLTMMRVGCEQRTLVDKKERGRKIRIEAILLLVTKGTKKSYNYGCSSGNIVFLITKRPRVQTFASLIFT